MKKLLILIFVFSIFSKILISGEKEGEELFKKGLSLFKQEKVEEALKLFDRATQEKANFAEGYYYIGLCYAKLGEIKKARQNLIYAKILSEDEELKNRVCKVLEDIEKGKYKKVVEKRRQSEKEIKEEKIEEVKKEKQSEVKEETKKEKILLTYKFKVGDIARYGVDIEDEEEGYINGRRYKRNQQIYVEFKEETTSIDEKGNGIIKLTLLKALFNGKNLESGEKEAYIKVTPRGKIIESRNLQEIMGEFFKVIRKSLSETIPGFDRIPVKIDFKKLPSNQFNTVWEITKPILPEEEIGIGESWEVKPRKWQKDIGQKEPIKYTLKSKEGKNYIITLKLEQGKEKINGEVLFDLERGRIIKQYVEVIIPKAKGKLNINKLLGNVKQKNIPSTVISFEIKKRTKFNLKLLEK